MRRSNGSRRIPSKKAGRARERANTKRTGEISEAAFLHKAVSLGFKVTKPWGDSERYDLVVDSGKRLWRVQVKCTSALHAGGYHIQPIHYVYGKKKVVYTAEEIDVLAAHVVPLNVWYLVPVQALAQGTSLMLYPEGGCERARFEKYKEAWVAFGEMAEPMDENMDDGDKDDEEEEDEARKAGLPIMARNPMFPAIFLAELMRKK
jgi:PD-(D/E)XK endonuclease